MKFFKNKPFVFFVFFIFSLFSAYYYPFFRAQLSEKSYASERVSSPYLSCPALKERTKDFLNNHYIYHKFDSVISSRTFNTYFKLLDPGKLYFTQNDIDSFKEYETKLGLYINNKNCQFISDVYNLYKKRVQESTEITFKILKNPFDFNKDEHLETDRKKVNWAKTNKEIEERLRKTLKFIALNMNVSDDGVDIKERLKNRYKMLQKNIFNKTDDEINSTFLNSFALALDPHSSFFTPIDNMQFQIDFSLKLVGIGATLTSPEGYTTIDSVVAGGAAALDGHLKKGDKIVAVDSGNGSGMQDVIDMDLDKVVQLIRGKEGTPVKLVVLRKETDGGAKRFQLQLMRAIVQIKDSEAKSDVMTIDNKKIGIINLPSFYIDYKGCQDSPTDCRSSSNDMLREINKLMSSGVDGIVVDLRKNGGGDLSEAQRIVNLFIDNPVVTQVQDRDDNVRSLNMDGKSAYRGPLALLVSRYSASASEIFAGAVKDYGRGLVVGDTRTFGKGTVQTVIEITPSGERQTDGAIHVTIAKFFGPSGMSNQEKGVYSDVVIPDVIDATNTGESEYDYALPYTTISPAKDFVPEQNLQKIIPKLKDMSSVRVKKSTEFQKIFVAIKKAQDSKSTFVSLKEPIVKKGSEKDDSKKKDPNLLNDENDSSAISAKVIRPNDVNLSESANILTDAMTLLDNKSDWTK